MIIRGWGWVPGWVTVMSLCCFCNVALIFATMKTFILQQVKCCHLSPFLFKPNSEYFLTLLFIKVFSFLYHEFSLCFLHHLLFISEITPDSTSHSLIVCLWISASGDLWWDCCLGGWAEGFNFSQPLHLSRSQPPHLCYGFTVTNEKSVCPVDSDVVLGQRILASCSCFSVTSFNFQFIGLERVGEGRLSFFLFLCFSHLKLYNLCSFLL